jgi:hypothetical protein
MNRLRIVGTGSSGEEPVRAIASEDHIRPRTRLAEAAIKRIIDLRSLMPKDSTTELWWANLQLGLPPNRSNFLIKYALLDTEIRATYRTPGWLEDHFHAVTVTTDQQAFYHRLPFNVDCQKVPSDEIHLEDMAAISSSPEALMALSSIATALSSERIAGWPNLISPGPVLQPAA